MNQPLIQVIIPTYNRAKLLPRAVKSVTNQNYDKWHVIIVDDGSKDDTKDVVAKLIKEHKGKITYIYKENGGVGSARNKGIEHVLKHGGEEDLILFLDSDDSIVPGALKKITKITSKHPEEQSFMFGTINDKGKRTFWMEQEELHVTLKDYLQGRVGGEMISCMRAKIFRNKDYRYHERVQTFERLLWFKVYRDVGTLFNKTIIRRYHEDEEESIIRARISEKMMRNAYKAIKIVIEEWGEELERYNKRRLGTEYLVLARAAALISKKEESLTYFRKGIARNPLDLKRIALYLLSLADKNYKMNNWLRGLQFRQKKRKYRNIHFHPAKIVFYRQFKHTIKDFDPKKSILDFACEKLQSACFFYGHDYTGADIDQDSLATGKKLYPQKNFKAIQADLAKPPFKDKSFDYVISTHSLDHLTDRETRKQAIKKLSRIAKERFLFNMRRDPAIEEDIDRYLQDKAKVRKTYYSGVLSDAWINLLIGEDPKKPCYSTRIRKHFKKRNALDRIIIYSLLPISIALSLLDGIGKKTKVLYDCRMKRQK